MFESDTFSGKLENLAPLKIFLILSLLFFLYQLITSFHSASISSSSIYCLYFSTAKSSVASFVVISYSLLITSLLWLKFSNIFLICAIKIELLNAIPSLFATEYDKNSFSFGVDKTLYMLN